MCEISSAKVVTFPPPRQEGSPVHRLVYGWWRTPKPALFAVQHLRERLYEAALKEIRLLSGSGKAYDPNCDYRFKWACQWLELGDTSRRAIDPDIAMMADFLFGGPPSPCGKDKAAGETPTQLLG